MLSRLAILGLLLLPLTAAAQTPDDISQLIAKLLDLDSIDITPGLKFRPGIEPPLYELDADESGMQVLEKPYEVFGKNQPGAAGWYRVSFTVPEKIGKFPVPPGGFNMGVESNCIGSWEVYTYNNGKSVGAAMAPGVQGSWADGNVVANSRQRATAWMSNAPIPTKPGDKFIVAILNTASPLGRGSAEGFGLRYLRLRFALGHTLQRQPFYGVVSGPGQGSGMHGVREALATRKGDELAALQAKLKEPLANLDKVFAAAETGKLDHLTNAMKVAIPELNEALKVSPPAK